MMMVMMMMMVMIMMERQACTRTSEAAAAAAAVVVVVNVKKTQWWERSEESVRRALFVCLFVLSRTTAAFLYKLREYRKDLVTNANDIDQKQWRTTIGRSKRETVSCAARESQSNNTRNDRDREWLWQWVSRQPNKAKQQQQQWRVSRRTRDLFDPLNEDSPVGRMTDASSMTPYTWLNPFPFTQNIKTKKRWWYHTCCRAFYLIDANLYMYSAKWKVGPKFRESHWRFCHYVKAADSNSHCLSDFSLGGKSSSLFGTWGWSL